MQLSCTFKWWEGSQRGRGCQPRGDSQWGAPRTRLSGPRKRRVRPHRRPGAGRRRSKEPAGWVWWWGGIEPGGEAAAGQEVRALQAVFMLHCAPTLSSGCCATPGRPAGRAAAGCSQMRLRHEEDGGRNSRAAGDMRGKSRHRPAARSTCGSPSLKTGTGRKTGAKQKGSAAQSHAHPGGRPRPRAAGSCVPTTSHIKEARRKVGWRGHRRYTWRVQRNVHKAAWGRNPTPPAVARQPRIPRSPCSSQTGSGGW